MPVGVRRGGLYALHLLKGSHRVLTPGTVIGTEGYPRGRRGRSYDQQDVYRIVCAELAANVFLVVPERGFCCFRK